MKFYACLNVVFLFVCIQSCGQELEPMTKQTNNIISNFKERPYYQIDVRSSGVSFDIRINDFPVFNFFGKTGGTNMEVPINNAILKSGVQSISIKVLPLKGKKLISKQDEFTLKVNLKEDAYVYDNKRIEVLSMPKMLIGDKGVPYWEYIGEFNADVPYVNQGWSNGQDLTKFNKQELEKKVYSKYKEIQKIIEKKDNYSFQQMVELKLKEEAIALYEKLDENPEGFQNNPEKGLSLEGCKMKFYGKGKLVTLEDEYGESCLKTEVIENSEKIIYTYPVYLHIPQGSNELEIIR